MAYSKQTWVRGEKVASTKLNHMEDGISTISANGAIGTANLANGAVTLPKLADAVKEHFALADDVEELDADVNGGAFTFTKAYMSNNNYSTNRVYNAQASNIGKKLSEIYSAATTNTFAYMLDVTLSKSVKFPTGSSSSTSNYGCLAFDKDDVCVWTRQYTAGDVAGNMIEVTLPINATKMLLVFGNSLNALGTEYVVELTRYAVPEKTAENTDEIEKLKASAGTTVRGSFAVNAGASHSSTADQLSFSCPANHTFYIEAAVDDADDQSLMMIYAIKSDGASENIANWYPKKAARKIFKLTVAYDIAAIGVFYQNRTQNTVTVSVIVTDRSETENSIEMLDALSTLEHNVGRIYRTQFTVNAGATHSSANNRTVVSIPANTPFILGFDVTSANGTAVAMLYAVKEDDTTVNFMNIYPGLTVNKLCTVTLDYSVKAIGVFYSNTVSEAVTVSILVAIGQIDTDAIYDNQHDVLFVEELNADMPRAVFAKYADTTNAETFVFFSDPHYLLNNGGMTTARINQLDCEWLRQLKTKADAINAQVVICGGDLINAEQTDAELCYKLGMHHAIARKLFGEKYHLALGNHDTRFDATSQSVLDNLLFAEEDTQKAYFAVKTPKTMFYFLNTGTDQNGAMTTYRWTQIAWLAEHLQTDTESNRAIAMHIFSNDASGDPANFGNGITPMATHVVSLINAYNSKGTVTLNGVTYNFATATGKIRFLLCGHEHYDTVYYATGDIPVICIDDATAIGTRTKLIMYSCLADYENGKLYAYRDGTETVEIDLA